MRFRTFALSCALVGCSSNSSSPAPPNDASVRDASVAEAGPIVDGGSDAYSTPDAPADVGLELDAGPCTSPDFAGSPFGIHCNQLVDSQGRTAIIHGINARIPGVFDNSFTDGRQAHEPLPPFGASDVQRMRALGFNTLRLPINWSAVEPTEDGGISTSYLDTVASITAMCAAANLNVLVDLHQDDYSKEIGEDGAPLWAIQPPPTQLLGGPVPSNDNESGQVLSAFSTFFDPTNGVYLRQRYTAMATAVAARFADDPAVVGFELYNEPYTGDELLHALYDEMVPSMRAAAPKKLLFWEPYSLRIESGAAETGDGGPIGPGTVYAVHIYNIGTAWGNEATLLQTLSNAQGEAQSWGAPLVVTEYGYDPSSSGFAPWVDALQDVASDVGASDMFWLWKEESGGFWGLYSFDDAGVATERPATVRTLTRARLEALAGTLVSVSYDETAQKLEVQFIGSSAITAANVVSVGAEASPPAAQWMATCDGASVQTNGADPLQIPCGGDGSHVLVVTGGPAAGGDQ
jgi:endoglycosylceramidase